MTAIPSFTLCQAGGGYAGAVVVKACVRMDESGQLEKAQDDASTASDKRKRPRQSLMMQAEVTLAPDLPPIDVRVRNLSSGGALVACKACPELGDKVHIKLRGIGKVAGKVTRATGSTVAIQFDQSVDVAQAQAVPPRHEVQILHHNPDPRRPGLKAK